MSYSRKSLENGNPSKAYIKPSSSLLQSSSPPMAGITNVLVKRVESAIRKECASIGDSNNRLKKRERNKPEDVAIEIENGNERNSKKEKLKGSVVLDQYISDHVKSQYHVLQQGEEIYDATLNQNDNKFYIIQALESDDGCTFMVYNRWGIVGTKGQDKMHGPYTCVHSALYEFEQKFHAKTKTCWYERKQFVSNPKSYTWLERDYGTGELTVHEQIQGDLSGRIYIQPRDTKLEPRIANFITLICNPRMMKQNMVEIGYNAEKLPLDKLCRARILEGYEVLKRIADVIGQHNKKQLAQLSEEFYTIIPHDFGSKKIRKLVIDTPQRLISKLEMVKALGGIEVATKLLEDNDETDQEDPLLSRYERLQCELTPIEVDTKEFNMIMKYMKNTHGKTHSDYSAEIVQIFRTSRHGEADRFSKFLNTKNMMLLWHGSRLTNWTGILSRGLQIAPPEAPPTGYMFGKGVYFADMFSKSANYCYASHQASDGVLLLCEVALGEMAELLTAKYDADKLPLGKLSTKGVGGTTPDMSQIETMEDGVVVPLGKPKKQRKSKASLLYNEYIAYNVDQIRMRYVVHVNFSFRQ